MIFTGSPAANAVDSNRKDYQMTSLSGKTAIITGASSGIGRAAALLFAAEDARLVIGARRQGGLERVAEEIRQAGGEVVVRAGDVGDEAYCADLVQTARQTYGRLDIAFNNAGMLGDLVPLPDMTPENWRQVMETNLTSAFLCARHQLPAMLEAGSGSMIFTGTFVGHTAGMPGMAAYAASKAGLVGLTQVLAAEYGPQNIRVNALLPGGVDTPMAADFANTPETREFVNGLHALKRVARPEEIARSALFLASGAGSFITGTAMRVDGGVSINRT